MSNSYYKTRPTHKGRKLVIRHKIPPRTTPDIQAATQFLSRLNPNPNTTSKMTITQIKTARFYNLNLTATEALLTLGKLGMTDMTGLAAELAVSTAAITTIAQRLIGARLIERRYSADDRRVIYLRLTELGAARVHQLTGDSTAVATAPALGLRYTR